MKNYNLFYHEIQYKVYVGDDWTGRWRRVGSVETDMVWESEKND